VEVSAFVSHGFEDFTLFDPSSPHDERVWTEYGGTVGSNTLYCCGVTRESARATALVVEGVATDLLQDAEFRKFNRVMQSEPEVVLHATLRGYFFAGEQATLPSGKRWVGFGHFGFYSLFVIEQVVRFSHSDLKDVDYRVVAETPDGAGSDCFLSGASHVDFTKAIEMQRRADTGERLWAFSNPSQLVVSHLTEERKHPFRISRTVKRSRGRVVYEVVKFGTAERYWATVSRPYWLTIFAKDPRRVAWTLLGTTSIDCGVS
jgi:hypothetical protein